VLLAAGRLEAQVPSPGRGLVPTPLETVRPGWTISPAMEYGWGWDDNVLVVANPDQLVGDQLQIFNPLVETTYHGRLSEFSGRYSGAISLYNDLTTLNSYDQRASANFRRSLTPRVAMFIAGGASAAPTTELIELSASPADRVVHQDIRRGHRNGVHGACVAGRPAIWSTWLSTIRACTRTCSAADTGRA
jgi:hypothetical protein